jgi:hypothetical protein
MKKLTLIALLVLPATIVCAQSPKIGFKAGLNVNHISSNDHDLKHDLKPRPSIHLGLIADFEVSKSLSFQPQLLFSGRGAKESHGDHSDVIAFNSLELPLNFVYRKNSSKGLFVGMGPSLGYNLSGKIKGHDESESIEFGSAEGEIKRFDVGVNALVGYQVSKKFLISTNYNLGLSNWSNMSSSTWRNNIAGISIGYFLK